LTDCSLLITHVLSKGFLMAIQLVSHNPAWSEQFEIEAKKLIGVFDGWAWEGGLVYLLEHVGSTSIPGIVAKPCIDIVVGVYPFPLEPNWIQRLENLGYTYRGENGIPGRQYFQRGPHDYHVHVYDIGNDDIHNYLVFRDYLRVHGYAREQYEALKLELAKTTDSRSAYTDGKTALVQTLLAEGYTCHIEKTAFKPVEFVKNEFDDVGVPWCVAGGWGLDLFLNKPTRYHADLDVCIWREDQRKFLEHLKARGWQLHVPVKGKYRPWQEGEFLELPLIQIHCRREDMPFEMLDILLMEHDDRNWIYRREPKVTMPKDEVMAGSARGVTILNPALPILFKSRTADKEPRGKDQKDFEGVLPFLTDEQKQWLEYAFELWMPDHPWCKRVRALKT
jgi:GrpB-like predicted nucleotidyltransferase (UPF0157 family)